MKEITLIIDSRFYPEQSANNLKVFLDNELRKVDSMRIIYAGIPCTFYNISQKLSNNNLLIPDGTDYKYINFPDGFYDLKTYDKQLTTQLKKIGLQPRAISFGLDETSGKALISFRAPRSGKDKYKLSINIYLKSEYQQEIHDIRFTIKCVNSDLLGFNVPGNSSVTLPRRIRDPSDRNRFINEDIAIGDKAVNFKPFDYFLVHCDIINTETVLYNGEKSDLLVRIPVKECDFGELNQHYLTGLRSKKCHNTFNSFRIWLTDENNNPIDFNGADIQYELLFLINE